MGLEVRNIDIATGLSAAGIESMKQEERPRGQGPLLRMGGIRFSGIYLRRRRNEAASKKISPAVPERPASHPPPLLSLLVQKLGFVIKNDIYGAAEAVIGKQIKNIFTGCSNT